MMAEMRAAQAELSVEYGAMGSISSSSGGGGNPFDSGRLHDSWRQGGRYNESDERPLETVR